MNKKKWPFVLFWSGANSRFTLSADSQWFLRLVLTLSQTQVLTPRSYPIIYCDFNFVLVVLHFGIKANINLFEPSRSQSRTRKIILKKIKTITAVSSTTRKLSLSFPYLEPKSCPIIVLSIKRPDIQANQRLQSKNPQSSLQIPSDHKDKEKRNKSAAIVPHYHQQATTFRFGRILSRQLLRMPTP